MMGLCATIAAIRAGIARPKKPAAPIPTSIIAWRSAYFLMIALSSAFRCAMCERVLKVRLSCVVRKSESVDAIRLGTFLAEFDPVFQGLLYDELRRVVRH